MSVKQHDLGEAVKLLRLPFILFCLIAFATAAAEPPPHVKSQDDLAAHLAALEQSPLRYFSEPGRKHFLSRLMHFEDGFAYPSSLLFELSPAQQAQVHALFGRDEDARSLAGKTGVNLAETASPEIVEAYWRFVRELDDFVNATENHRESRFRAAVITLLREHLGALLDRDTGGTDIDTIYAIKAMDTAFFYTGDASLVRRMEELVDALVRRFEDPSIAALRERTYQHLLVAREMNRAEAFAKRHAVTPVEWKVSGNDDIAGRPAVLKLRNDGLLTAETVDFEALTGVVVSVSPYCSFSKAAMRYIETDRELLELLEDRVLWLADQRLTAELPSILEWNDESELDMHLVWKDSAWPEEIDFGATPFFYFVRNGEIVETLKGWENDGNAELLKKKIKAMLE